MSVPEDPTLRSKPQQSDRRLPTGRTVGLVAINSLDYLAQYFDLSEQGHTVASLRSADDRQRLGVCAVDEVVTPAPGHGWFDRRVALNDSDEPAQLAFTSGTEGEPKGVLLSHRNLSSTARRIIDACRLDESVREYVGVPVYHSFGLGRVRAIGAVGGRAYVPENGFDVRELVSMLAAGEINSVSAVPSLWRVVLRNSGSFAQVAAALRWIEIGSQPMAPAEKGELRALFPNARIVQHYGLTEASRSTFLVVSDVSEAELDSVGVPTGDVDIRIGAGGCIEIRGSNVARELILSGEVVPNVDADGWMRTGDVGEIVDGRLRCLGRADDLMNLGGVKVSPEVLEHGIGVRVGSRETYCVTRVPDALRGDGVLVAVLRSEPLPDEQLYSAAVAALAELGVRGGSSVHVRRYADLPRTASGKPRRAQLAAGFSSDESIVQSASYGNRPFFDRHKGLGVRDESGVRACFSDAFAGRQLRGGDSFVSLGGDSLRFVEISLKLEQAIGQLPERWQEMTIDELASIPHRSAWLHEVDSTVFFRCFGMIAIVAGHFGVADVGGATFLLLALAGYNFARLQIPKVIEDGSSISLLISAWRIALPTFLAMVALELRHLEFVPAPLLLADNWTPAVDQEYGFWFAELLVQLLLLIALLLAVPAMRSAASRKPFTFALAVVAGSVLLAMVGPVIWDTEHLWHRVPHMLLWLFSLGWLLHVAQTRLQRATVMGCVVALPPLIWMGDLDKVWLQHGLIWVCLGLTFLAVVPRIKVPRPLNVVVGEIASASLFIYLTHFTTQGIWQRYGVFQSAHFEVLLGVVVGILAWRLWDAAGRVVARIPWCNRLSRSA